MTSPVFAGLWLGASSWVHSCGSLQHVWPLVKASRPTPRRGREGTRVVWTGVAVCVVVVARGERGLSRSGYLTTGPLRSGGDGTDGFAAVTHVLTERQRLADATGGGVGCAGARRRRRAQTPT